MNVSIHYTKYQKVHRKQLKVNFFFKCRYWFTFFWNCVAFSPTSHIYKFDSISHMKRGGGHVCGLFNSYEYSYGSNEIIHGNTITQTSTKDLLKSFLPPFSMTAVQMLLTRKSFIVDRFNQLCVSCPPFHILEFKCVAREVII